MFEQMKKSDAVRLQLASSYAAIANYWKFFDGEAQQLLKYDVFGQKRAAEEKFIQWAKGKADYENVFAEYEKAYKAWWPYAKHRIYMNEGILGSPLATYAASWQALENALTRETPSTDEIARVTESLKRTRTMFLQNENKASDERILAATCRMYYHDIESAQHPAEFIPAHAPANGDLSDEATYKKFEPSVFEPWCLTMPVGMLFHGQADVATLPMRPYAYVSAFVKFQHPFTPTFTEFTHRNSDLSRLYLKVARNEPRQNHVPDANLPCA